MHNRFYDFTIYWGDWLNLIQYYVQWDYYRHYFYYALITICHLTKYKKKCEIYYFFILIIFLFSFVSNACFVRIKSKLQSKKKNFLSMSSKSNSILVYSKKMFKAYVKKANQDQLQSVKVLQRRIRRINNSEQS